MKKITPFFILLIITFSSTSMKAQTLFSGIDDPKHLEIAFDSNDPDQGIYSLVNEFKQQNIAIAISNIKRNSANQITAIDIVMKSAQGEKKELHIDRKTPIKGIMLYVDKINKPNWEFGVKELDNTVN